MTERDLQRTLLDAARWLGWMAYHTFDSRRCAPGFPDLVLVHPVRGQLLYAELKSDRGRLRPEQCAWLDALRSAGAECHVWKPADIDIAIARLRGVR